MQYAFICVVFPRQKCFDSSNSQSQQEHFESCNFDSFEIALFSQFLYFFVTLSCRYIFSIDLLINFLYKSDQLLGLLLCLLRVQ